MHRILAVWGLAVGASVTLAGPLSPYYLVSGDQFRVDVVQGAAHINSWATPDFEYPVAVNGTVRTLGAILGGTGREYSLGGVVTGPVYTNVVGTSYDSTTDGQHNYVISWDTGDVIQTDTDYQNPVPLFNVGGPGTGLGITYDPTNNSLWIAQFGGGTVENRTLAGGLISSFNTGISLQAALALDHADGSLWLVEWTQNGDFRQFSKAGAPLGSEHYPALVGVNPLGGEFALPEPTSLALLTIGGLFLSRRRR
ncbi:MAG: hypothetical protein CHACPFDD_01277 [Phycisphaerae bacterium]|nr:hypothetical protein [Phycisphaerae bacterium]